MSQVYASEPPTSGRVIFDTTHGPLEISLWCTECPHTTRWFLQLCVDGFYDGVLVHRILPETLVQCGALRAASDHEATAPLDAVDVQKHRDAWQAYRTATGAKEALERQPYELHSRLRFKHRGMVALALPIDKNHDADDDAIWLQHPQFFVTLEEASYLDGQHVIFGSITGPTVFNAMRMGKLDVENNDDSLTSFADWSEAPRIRSVKIVDNPVHTQLAPQAVVPWRIKDDNDGAKKKKKRRKGKLDTNVLSFGDELEEEGVTITRPAAKKPKPSRPRADSEETEEAKKKDDTPGVNEATKMPPPPVQPVKPDTEADNLPAEAPKPPPPVPNTNDSSIAAQSTEQKSPKKMSAMEARRAKYSSKRKDKAARQEDTMAKLLAFQGRVKKTVGGKEHNGGVESTADDSWAARMARRAAGAALEQQSTAPEAETYHGQVLEDKDQVDVQSSSQWMATTFTCKRHIDHTAGSDGRKIDDYEVVDDQQSGDDHERRKKNKHHHGRHHHHHHHQKHSKKSRHHRE